MAGERIRRMVCQDCGHEKPIEQFRGQRRPNGEMYRYPTCKVCHNVKRRKQSTAPEELAARRERYASSPEHRRKVLSAQHRSRYGITLDEKDAMLAAQGGVCAACGDSESKGHGWATDHDHKCCPGRSCGECVRAILCTNCNLALGQVGDSIERLEALIAYLQRCAAGMTPGGNPNLQANVSRMQPI